MSLKIIPVRPSHVPELARICFEAFGALHDRHAVVRDFDDEETAARVLGSLASRDDVAGFAAEVDGRLAGSNFLTFSDPVAGVGPITVRADTQSRGVGKALMLAVMDEARRRGLGPVRLLQEAVNTASLSLYTKLGFEWRDACALMRPAPGAADDPRIRPATPADLDAMARVSAGVFHWPRRRECAHLLSAGLPGYCLEAGGAVRGYFFPGFIGHGFAPTAADLAALVSHAARHAPAGLHKCFVPLSQNDLHRALLERGGKTLKLLNYMTVGEFRRPEGAWMPSILD